MKRREFCSALGLATVGSLASARTPLAHAGVEVQAPGHSLATVPPRKKLLFFDFNQFYGPMDVQLTYSYDGVRFVRGPREPFLRLNPYPEHGCTQLRPYSLVQSDREIRIYSGASRASHGRERAVQNSGKLPQSITLHRMREDGFMYLRS